MREVKQEDVELLLNDLRCQILLVAESSLPATQFKAFRRITLNAFGNNGIGKELDRLFGNNTARHGTGRNILRKEGGAS